LLTVDGLQLPDIPFNDVTGRAGTDPPEQTLIDVPKLNVGVVLDPTVTLNVVDVAHCPAVGVNVYTAEEVLLTVAGFQLPVIPSIEVEASTGTVPPEHTVNDVPYENVGVMFGFTVTVKVAVVAHWPAVAVNV
jgi:hypothetical protein